MVAASNDSADLGSALQEEMTALVRAFGLHRVEETPCGRPVSVAEAYAISVLAGDRGLSQRDLGHRLDLAKSTVSRLVDKLVHKGFVTRESSADDRRVSLLSLTDEGRDAARQLDRARADKFAGVLEAIPESRREGVLEALGDLVQAMRSRSDPAR
jgi:DNA-binding MarR family transcriptional regulator